MPGTSKTGDWAFFLGPLEQASAETGAREFGGNSHGRKKTLLSIVGKLDDIRIEMKGRSLPVEWKVDTAALEREMNFTLGDMKKLQGKSSFFTHLLDVTLLVCTRLR